MTQAGGGGRANDPAVSAVNGAVDNRAAQKALAAVGYYEGEAQAAEDAAQRLAGKVDCMKAHLEETKRELSEAKESVKDANERLRRARARASEFEGGEG